MRHIILALLVFTFAQQSMAHIELYGSMNIGASKMDETQGGNSFTHTNSFFVGHWGFGGGGRFKYNIDKFGIGVVTDLSWLGDTFERKQTGGVTTDATYRFESYRLLGGATVSFAIGSFHLIGEYYPYAQNTVTYSDDKVENPYRKNDKLKATGFGLGFNYEFGSNVGYSVIYRRLTYKDVEMNGASVALPTAQYSALNIEDIIVSLVVAFK